MTSVTDLLDAAVNDVQRADADGLVALMTRVTAQPPAVWGAGIVGFGRYRYRYDSGREGESALVGFALRKGEFAVYLLADLPDRERLLSAIGRHRAAKACIYIKRLADIDLPALEALLTASVQETLRRYPPTA